MATIVIEDLAASKELDRNAMAGVTGGINPFAPQTNTEKPVTDITQSGNSFFFEIPIHQQENTNTAYPDSYPYTQYY